MVIKGKIEFENREYFTEYIYLEPIPNKITFEYDFIPVIAGKDFPRWLTRPTLNKINKKNVVDYSLHIIDDKIEMRKKAELFLNSNKFTIAKEDCKILSYCFDLRWNISEIEKFMIDRCISIQKYRT